MTVETVGAVLSTCTFAPEDVELVPRLSDTDTEYSLFPSESTASAVSCADWYAYADPGPQLPHAVSATVVWPALTVDTLASSVERFSPEKLPAPDGRSLAFAYT